MLFRFILRLRRPQLITLGIVVIAAGALAYLLIVNTRSRETGDTADVPGVVTPLNGPADSGPILDTLGDGKMSTPASDEAVAGNASDAVDSKDDPSVTSVVEKEEPSQTDRNEKVAVAYFTAYMSGNVRGMDRLAGAKAKHWYLTAHGLPNRLFTFLYWQDEPGPDYDAHFRMDANDTDGIYLTFDVRVRNGVITEVVNKRSSSRLDPSPGNGWSRTTRSDRLGIIRACLGTDNPKPNSGFVDVGDYKYKDYASATVSEESGEYVRFRGGRWRSVTGAQDYIFTQELDKLGVPKDVQREVFSSTRKRDAEFNRGQ